MFTNAAETINAAELGTPFHIMRDGTAREVADFPDPHINDVGHHDFENILNGYAPVSGLSGQFRYGGPIMHECEGLGPGTLQRIVDSLGECVIYLAAVLDYSDLAYEDPDLEPGDFAGWAILARPVDPEHEIYA